MKTIVALMTVLFLSTFGTNAQNSTTGNSTGKAMTAQEYNDQGEKLERQERYEEAFQLYMQAALKGHAKAQFHVGYCYFYGDGTEEDYSKAFKWFKTSAEQGDDEGQFFLGFCYEKGYGTKPDPKLAKEWYKKSAEQGNDMAKIYVE